MISMKEKKKSYPNPRFSSIEEEDKYWATHSPLAEGYPAEIQKEKQKRSSFLTIRFTGDELTRLRDLASSNGMGPSTYIRALIKGVLTSRQNAELVLSESLQQFQSILQSHVYDRKVGGSSMVKDKPKEQYRDYKDSFCILEASKLQLNQKTINDISLTMIPIIYQIISDACTKVIAPGDTEFKELKRISTKKRNT